MSNTANKIASILAQATGDTIADEIQLSENEKIDKATKAVKGVLDKAHAGIKIYFQAKPLHSALNEYNREEAIRMLCEFLIEHESFINSLSFITDRKIVYKSDPYADRSDEEIKTDIKFTILMVYCASISEDGLKIAAQKALKAAFGKLKKWEKSVKFKRVRI